MPLHLLYKNILLDKLDSNRSEQGGTGKCRRPNLMQSEGNRFCIYIFSWEFVVNWIF